MLTTKSLGVLVSPGCLGADPDPSGCLGADPDPSTDAVGGLNPENTPFRLRGVSGFQRKTQIHEERGVFRSLFPRKECMFRPWYSRWQQECTVPPAPRGPVWGEFGLGQAQRRGLELTLKTPSPSGGEGAAEGGREGRGQWREERGWQAPGPGLGAARGSMRASGRARARSSTRIK